jgi:hypothetical protein
MKTFNRVLCLAILSACAFACAKSDSKILTPTNCSDSPEITGSPLRCYGFSDSEGRKYLKFHEVRKGDLGERDYSQKFLATCFVWSKTSWVKMWSIVDFPENALCQVGPFRPEIFLSDIDHDNIFETGFFYSKSCDGLDPDSLKLMLHVKGKKHAIRGALPKTGEDLDRYSRRIDPSFQTLPRDFENYAASLWDEMAMPILDSLKKEVEN